MPRAAGDRREAEAARVAERVQDVSVASEGAREQAVVALVEVETGLLAVRDVHFVGDAVLVDAYGCGRVTHQRAHARLQALEPAHLDVGALEDAPGTRRVDEDPPPRFAPALGAG